MILSSQQEKALILLRQAIEARKYSVFVIRGYAGTGKSSWLKEVDNEYVTVVLTPTGKAARRVEEVSGIHARTLHSFLYIPKENKYGDMSFEPKLGEDFADDLDGVDAIVVDEASMLSSDLWRDVSRVAETFGLPLVLLGDGYQLPPVEKTEQAAPFSAMSDEFIGQFANYSIDFTEVFRQAKDSPILRVATAIRAGDDIPSLFASDFPILTIQQVYEKGAEYARGADGMVICHRNVTRHELNARIRGAAEFYGRMPQAGEKLMVTKNNYGLGVSNGEVITVCDKSKPLNRMPVVVRDSRTSVQQHVDFFSTSFFDGWRNVNAVMSVEGLLGNLKVSEFYVQKESGPIVLRSGEPKQSYLYANYGYAGTAHKAQGSQYDSVVMVIEPSIDLYRRDGRRWTYTALTRAIKDFSFATL